MMQQIILFVQKVSKGSQMLAKFRQQLQKLSEEPWDNRAFPLKCAVHLYWAYRYPSSLTRIFYCEHKINSVQEFRVSILHCTRLHASALYLQPSSFGSISCTPPQWPMCSIYLECYSLKKFYDTKLVERKFNCKWISCVIV